MVDPATMAVVVAMVKELVPLAIREVQKMHNGKLDAAVSDAELTIATYRAMDARAQAQARAIPEGGAGNGTL